MTLSKAPRQNRIMTFEKANVRSLHGLVGTNDDYEFVRECYLK
jgi:hypothetical protein